MKKRRMKIIALLLGVVIFFCIAGCSNDSKSSTEPDDELVTPSNLTASVVNDIKIKLDWEDNCVIEEGFIIERKNGNLQYEVIANVIENITTYTDNDAEFNTLYTYRICAYLQSNQSSYSNEVSSEIIPHISILNVPTDYSTIQEAIDEATEGDTVLVQPGTYIENIDYSGKNICVASLFLTTQQTSYISQTIIDGNNNGSVVKIDECENSATSLIGFTITNGNAIASTDYCGGGIYCSDSIPILMNLIIDNNMASNGGGGIFVDGDMYLNGADPLFQDLIITNNETTGGGGGLMFYRSTPIIDNVVISNNTADSHGGGIFFYLTDGSFNNVTINDNYSDQTGGGIYIWNSDTTINNSTISNNEARFSGNGVACRDSSPNFTNVEIYGNSDNSLYDDGGGVYIYENSDPVFTNVIIFDNKTGEGGGVFCTDNSSPIFRNVVISENIAETHGAGLYVSENSHINLRNCIIWNNSQDQINLIPGSSISAYYSDIQGGWAGTENIDVNPLFINPVNSDFHLEVNSPCIDTGDPSTFYNDPDGTRNDMGAYGGTNGNW